MTQPVDSSVASLVSQLADLLLQKKLFLATAESCTGGLISAACTDLLGSSAWFERGFYHLFQRRQN
jgi:nicotinamide-nucleotide amidase